MPAIDYTPSRARLISGIVAGCFVMLIFGTFIAGALLAPRSGPETTSSRLGIVAFCGFFVLLSIWGIGRSVQKLRVIELQITLDDEGVIDHNLKIGKILWTSVTQIRVLTTRKAGIAMTVLMPINFIGEDERLAALPQSQRLGAASNRALGYASFNLNLSTLKLKPEQLVSQMNAARECAGLAALPLLKY